jgi:signal transduction histidine kinase
VTNIVRNATRVLRGVIVFRLLLILLGVVVLVTSWPASRWPATPRPGPKLGMVMLVPTLITSLFLLIPGLEKPLGRFYLPIALFLAILDFSVQYGVAYMRPDHVGYVLLSSPGGQEVSFFWASTELILLVLLPCMLAGAAYGMRGAAIAASLATAIHLAQGVVIYAVGRPMEGFLTLLPLRIGVLYTFSLIGGSMADTWRREHRDLQHANRQLRGYAATAETLATSRERVRLAREMHDTLAHSLSALAVQLEALDTLQEVDPQAATAQLAKIRQHARVGLDEARRAILDLRSAPVEEMGLARAMEQMVTRFGQRNGIRTSWTLDGETFPLLPAQANALYRIVEEALRNVEQHAEAEQVTVGLAYGRGVTVSVQDDGRGFDPAEIESGRLGLVGIRERATLIDGEVSVDATPDHGTTLTVHIAEPWEE